MTDAYTKLRLLHVTCVALSGSFFTIRGVLRIANVTLANHRAVRVTSYVIDTALLASAISLTVILHQYPLTHAWLTAKVLLLALYIWLGMLALKRARTAATRIMAYLAALLVFGLIVGIAMTHQAAGWLVYLKS